MLLATAPKQVQIPVTVLTGTTLQFNRILSENHRKKCAVVVKDFGARSLSSGPVGGRQVKAA